jgi:hypothetical protein|tara:strand:- start:1071 stop:1835 length:765 start_codon:yes stop_codon:yes gene_type:complete
MTSHLIIPDTQVKDGVDTSHLLAMGKYIVAHKPDVIICIGDWWDMESLSAWDRGKLQFEGRRYINDISSGNEAMDLMLGPMKRYNQRKAKNKKARYRPRMIFTLGNHEYRIQRAVESSGEFQGLMGYHDLNLKDWEVYDFLEPVEVDGVRYAHYFSNPLTGKPWGGMIDPRLKNIGYSFTQGHTQTLLYGRRDLTNGDVINGVVCGAFYSHDEGYKGYQGNNHFRGFIHKRNVHEGNYDIEIVRLESLLEDYGE